MREIKFRVWDKVLQTWSKNSIDLAYTQDGIISFVQGDRFELVQFTGLHDKNGKEIYEGYVLKSSYWACNCHVIWKGGGFTLEEGEQTEVLERNLQDDEGLPLMVIEVIGNIYQNPELLKDGEPHEATKENG